jgi:hypothetical protein
MAKYCTGYCEQCGKGESARQALVLRNLYSLQYSRIHEHNVGYSNGDWWVTTKICFFGTTELIYIFIRRVRPKLSRQIYRVH